MSTLEKTIDLLHELPEQEIEAIYRYVQFVYHQKKETPAPTEDLDKIFQHLVGILPDTGKTLEEYQEEMLKAKRNVAYLKKIDLGIAQLESGMGQQHDLIEVPADE